MSDEVIMYALLPGGAGVRVYLNTDQGHDPLIDVIGDTLDVWVEDDDDTVDLNMADFRRLEDKSNLPMCEVPMSESPPAQVQVAPVTPPPTVGMSELEAAAYTVHTTSRHVCVYGFRGTGKMAWAKGVQTQGVNLDTRTVVCTAQPKPYACDEFGILEPMATKLHQSPMAYSEEHPASFYENMYKAQVKKDVHLAAMWRDADIIMILDAERIDECILGALLTTAAAFKTRLVLVADFARGFEFNKQHSFITKSPLFADNFSSSTFSTIDVTPANPMLSKAATSGDPAAELKSALLGATKRQTSDGTDPQKGPRITPYRTDANNHNERMFARLKGDLPKKTYRHMTSYAGTSNKKVHYPLLYSAPSEITLFRGCRVFNVIEQRLGTVYDCPDDNTVIVVYDSDLGGGDEDDLVATEVTRHVHTLIVKKETHTLAAIPLAYGWAIPAADLVRATFRRATFRVVLYPDADKGFKPLSEGTLYRVLSAVTKVEHLSVELLAKKKDGPASRIFIQGTVLTALKALFSSAEAQYGSQIEPVHESTQRAVSEVPANGELALGVYKIPDSLSYFLQTFPKGRKTRVDGWDRLSSRITGEFQDRSASV